LIQRATFYDSYASGNVFVDKATGAGVVTAGGFSGYNSYGLLDAGISLYRCFALGNVIAQRNSANEIYAGGLLGRSITSDTQPGIIQNSVALGASVTATNTSSSSATRFIGRIYGESIGTGFSPSGNQAFNGMRLLQSGTYSDGNPGGEFIPTTDANYGGNRKHGNNATLGNIHDRAFWTGLGYTEWDLNTVESRGYPRLRDGKGGVLGGQ